MFSFDNPCAHKEVSLLFRVEVEINRIVLSLIKNPQEGLEKLHWWLSTLTTRPDDPHFMLSSHEMAHNTCKPNFIGFVPLQIYQAPCIRSVQTHTQKQNTHVHKNDQIFTLIK